MKELCEQAGINRGTFYAHYTDIYDLRTQMESELMEDFQRTLDPFLDQHGHPPTPAEVYSRYIQLPERQYGYSAQLCWANMVTETLLCG